MSTQRGRVSKTVGGHSTLSGGTRVAVKTTRPWQPRLTFAATKEDCVFCSKPQQDEFSPSAGWKTFQNSNTPFPFHRLLIPTECWAEAKLRSLGGAELIADMLGLALGEVQRTRRSLSPVWVYAQIGYLAGQNITHLHWHLVEPPTDPAPMDWSATELLWESERFSTAVGGARTGQAVIRPRGSVRAEELLGDNAVRSMLGEDISRLVEIYNRKFNQPDYCVFFGFHRTEWFVRYTPILNIWGGGDYAALDCGTPFVLSWPHTETVRYLREES